MRLLLAFLLAAAITSAADPIAPGKYTGKWQGESGASGDFTLTLASPGAGQWKAEVSFKMGDQEVPCNVTAVLVDGSKLHVVYTFDLLGTKLESTIDGDRTGAKVSGKYRTRSVADNAPVDQGTWDASLT